MVTCVDLMIASDFYESLKFPELDMEVLEFKTACYMRWAAEEIYRRLEENLGSHSDLDAIDVISEFGADMEHYICKTEDDLDQCLIFEVAADTAEALKIYSNNTENHD